MSEFSVPEPFVAAGGSFFSEPAFFAVIKFKPCFVFGNEFFVFSSEQFEFGLQHLKTGACEMFVAQCFVSGGGQAEFGGPMAVFVFEAVQSFEHAREMAAKGFRDVFRTLEASRVAAGAVSKESAFLKLAHLRPEFVISAEFVLLLWDGFEAGFEIRIINGVHEDGEDAGEIFGVHDDTIGVIARRCGEDVCVQRGGIDEKLEVAFRASADLPSVGPAFFDDAEKSEL